MIQQIFSIALPSITGVLAVILVVLLLGILSGRELSHWLQRTINFVLSASFYLLIGLTFTFVLVQ